MDFSISITFAGVAILLVAAGIAFSRVNYFKRFKETFSFKNRFPFEFNYEAHFVDNLLGNAFIIFGYIALILFYSSFKGSRDGGVPIFIFISGILSSVLTVMLYFISTKMLRIHIVILALCYAMVFMLQAATGLLNLEYYNQYHNPVNLVGIIYSFTLALITFLSVMNPKLSFRIQAKEVKQDGEEAKYVRPNWIAIAFSEWVAIFGVFLNIVGVILFLISICF